MLLAHKQVAILGAGPVGLILAKLLQQAGVAVTVYERDKNPQARIWGGTLDLHRESGQKAMQRAGLLTDYYAQALPMGIVFADTQGHALSTKSVTADNRYDNPEINRNDLRNLLLGSLDSDTVVWDRKVTDLSQQDGQWLLHFEDGPAVTADVVIIANGGMSKVRGYVTDAQVEPTGTIIIQGDIPQPELNCPAFFQLCAGNRLMTAQGGNLLVANPCNSGVLTYGLIFKEPRDWAQGNGLTSQNTAGVRAFLADRFAGWADLYQQLFQATDPFWVLPTRKLPLDKPWKTDRPLPITLIGDAAHLMPPFAGQGVNTGLLDALLLSDCLTSGAHETIQAAIGAYEQQMRVYATEAQHESEENELQMRHPDFSFQQFIL